MRLFGTNTSAGTTYFPGYLIGDVPCTLWVWW